MISIANGNSSPYITHGPNVDMDEAMKEVSIKANEGNAEAQFDLGLHYANGDGVNQNFQQAFKWVKKAADQDLPMAQLLLGGLYVTGRGVEKDEGTGISYVKKAAKNGLLEAQLALAQGYASYNEQENSMLGGQDFDAARFWLQRASDAGSLEATYELALFYRSGKGGPKDHAKAISLLTEAAMKGDEQSISELERSNDSDRLFFSTALLDQANDLYYMKSDSESSLASYKKSADLGNIPAKAQLAKMMYLGEGMTQDKATAKKWFSEVNQPLKNLAQSGDPFAQYLWGYYYDAGFNGTASPDEAVVWYQRAAEQGYAPAQNNLGYCLSNGDEGAQDYVKAVYWITKAAEKNHVVAQANLAGCYKRGEGVTQDYDQALSWYLKAVGQGYAPAAKQLGIMCENGEGCANQQRWYDYFYFRDKVRNDEINGKDLAVALIWYHTAVKLGDTSAEKRIDALMDSVCPSPSDRRYNDIGSDLTHIIANITDTIERIVEEGCNSDDLNDIEFALNDLAYREYIEDGKLELLVDFAKKYYSRYWLVYPDDSPLIKIADEHRSSLRSYNHTYRQQLLLDANKCSKKLQQRYKRLTGTTYKK